MAGSRGCSRPKKAPLPLATLLAFLLAPISALSLRTQTPTGFSLKNLVAAYDGIIVDAGPRGPLHDGERLDPRGTKLLDLMEAVGKPVVFAVDGVCPEDIERGTCRSGQNGVEVRAACAWLGAIRRRLNFLHGPRSR
jgi:hypothetical protein